MLTVLVHKHARGLAPNDVTSYLPLQREWGPDRIRDWPKIQDNILHRLERNGYPIPDYDPEEWWDHGRIVLSSLDNLPIKRYKVIPDTLSSKLSGRDMEAMRRLDLRIQQRDFRARMPRKILLNGGVVKHLYDLSTVGMRMSRFRKANGLLSWVERQGSKEIREARLKAIPRANLELNTTWDTAPPDEVEQEEYRAKNRGKFLNRAGVRALPEWERKRREYAAQRRLEKLRQKKRLEAGGNHQKRIASEDFDRSDHMRSRGKRRRRSDYSVDDGSEERTSRRRMLHSYVPDSSMPGFRKTHQDGPSTESFPPYLLNNSKKNRKRTDSPDDENSEKSASRRRRLSPNVPDSSTPGFRGSENPGQDRASPPFCGKISNEKWKNKGNRRGGSAVEENAGRVRHSSGGDLQQRPLNRILKSKIDHRYKPVLLQYLVDRTGSHPIWEHFTHLAKYQNALDDFHDANPKAPGPHVAPCNVVHCQCSRP